MVNDNSNIAPFVNTQINNPDLPSNLLAVSVTLDLAAKGSFTAASLTASGFTGGSGVYNFSGTAAMATTAIRQLVFVPAANRVTPTQTETTTFTISVNDSIAPVVTDNTTTVVSTSINDAPTIVGTSAGQTVTDKSTVLPFTGVTIGDVDSPDQTQAVSVTLDIAAKGSFTAASLTASGFTGGSGVYNFSGTAAAATTAIRQLVFAPAANRVTPTQTETTTLTIASNDGALTTSNNTTTVVATSVNDAPTISGAVSGQLVTDKTTVSPFIGVTIGDVDFPAQTQAVSVTLDTAAKGSFTAASLTASGFTGGSGVYNFSGTAAAATTAIRQLVFAPAANRVTPTQTETTTLTIASNDGALNTSDNTTTVVSTSINDAPTITGTPASQTIYDNQTVKPFSTVVIGDVDNPAQTQAVTVTLDTAAKGSFTTLNGFTPGIPGLYTFSGTAAAATTAIQGLVFTPTPDRVAPPLSETTTFTLSSFDGIATTTDAQTTVVSVSFNDPPTFTIPASTVVLQSNGSSYSDPTFAQSISVGTPDEVLQTITGFTITQNSNTGISYTIPPAITWNGPGDVTTGTLTVQVQGASTGKATYSVYATDSGPAAPSPNNNQSATTTFTIIAKDLNHIYVDPAYGSISMGTSVNFPDNGSVGPHTVGYDAFGTLASAYSVLLANGTLHLTGPLSDPLTLTSDLTVFVPAGATATMSGVIGNGGFGLIKTGPGKLILTNTDTVKFVDVQGGTLLVNGTTVTAASGVTVESGAILGGSGGTYAGTVTVLQGGTFSPGASIGVTNVTGDLILNGALTIELIGYTGAGDPGTGYDQLNVSGTITINPTASLVLSLTGGLIIPGITDAGVVTYGVRSGTFSDVSIQSNTGHLAYTLGYDAPYLNAIAVQLDIGTDVFVDGNFPVSEDTDGDQFFKSISPAKDFVTAGGKVHVKGNMYAESVTLDKDFTFLVDAPADLVQITGNLSGTNALTKDGPGTLELDGAANTNAAQVNVSGGALYIDGVLTMAPSKIVQLNGGKLGGSGTINGAISMTGSGGTIQPGGGIGVFGTLTATNAVSLAGSGTLRIKVKNQGLAGDYDVFAITSGNSLTLNPSSSLIIDIKNLYQSTGPIQVVTTTVANGVPTAFQLANISLVNPPLFAPTPILSVTYPSTKRFVAIQITLPPPTTVVVDGMIIQPNGTILSGIYNGRVVGYDAFNTVQAGVNAVAANGTVTVATGSYNETVTIGTSNQPIKLVGTGSPTVNKFIVNTTVPLKSGSGGVTAPIVDLSQGAAIADGLLLASSNITGGPTINLAPGATSFGAGALTQDVQFNVVGGSAIVGALTGTGVLTKIGSDTLIATGISSYSGPTKINAGTLEADGSLTSVITVGGSGTLTGSGTTGAINVLAGGQITPGTIAAPGAGLGVLSGGNTDLSNGTLNLKLNKIASPVVAGTDYGQLNLGANTLTLGGSSKLVLDVGSLPAGLAAPATVTIITYSGVPTPKFTTVQLLGDSTNKYTYSLNYTATGLQLTLAPHTNTFVDSNWATGVNPGDTVFFFNDSITPHVFGADAYATVQGGVDNVVASFSVFMAPRSYLENVTINKALSLVGAKSGTPGYTNPAAGPVPQLSSGVRPNSGETVLTSSGGAAAILTINAAPVIVDGVRVLLPATGSGGLNQGIVGSALATSVTIQNTVFDYSASLDANTIGVNLLNAATLAYTCQQNAFTGKVSSNGTASNTSQTTAGSNNVSGLITANLFVQSSVGISGALGTGTVANNVLIGGGTAAVGIHGAFNGGCAVMGNTFATYSSASGAAVIVSATPVGQLGLMTFTGNTLQSCIEELQLDDTSGTLSINTFTIQARTPSDLESIVSANTFDHAVYITDSTPKVLDESGVVHVRGTIQSAVNNALASNTVHVLNGTYIENVAIPKALTILGNGVANTIVKPFATGDIFTLSHDTISIKNLTIDGSNGLALGANAVVTNSAPTLTNIVVDGVTIKNVTDCGVKNASSNGSTTVNNCTISTVTGAVAANSAGMFISNGSATVTNNTISSAPFGVIVSSSPALATVNIGTLAGPNTISTCTVGVISRTAGSTTGDSIAFNTLTSNTYGAIIEHPTNAASKVASNIVTSNTYGIAVFGGVATVSNNTISPTGTGVLASSIITGGGGGDAATTVTVTSNTFTGLNTAIAVAKGANATQVDASLNTISASAAGVGVQFIANFTDYLGTPRVGSGGSANLTNNSLTGLATGAIANNSGVLKLLQNTIQSNTIGVDVNGGTINTIQNNFINMNGVGIQYEIGASNAGTIFNNDLSGNTTFALNNLTALVIDASGNWWGGNIPASVIATLSGLTDYSPWLHAGTPGTPPGFNGDFSWLHVDNHSAMAGAVQYIQEGVNSATAGGKVQVEDGNGPYLEDVAIAKDLTLVSTHGSGFVTIAGQSLAATSGAIKVTSGMVKIGTSALDGFTINGAGQAAVYLDTTAGVCSLKGNILSAANGKNAVLALVSGHTLDSNTFTVATGGSAAELVNVAPSATPITVNNNSFTGANTIGLLQQAEGSTVTGNDFSASASTDARLKINVTVPGTITGNNFKGALPGGGFGAQFWDLKLAVAPAGALLTLYNANTFDRGALAGYVGSTQLAGGNGQAIFDRIAKSIAAVAGGATPSPIDIRNGTYDETNIAVDKSVILTGQSVAGVKVVPAAATGSAFVLSSGAVTIQMVTVDGNVGGTGTAYDKGVSTSGAAAISNVTITQNTLQNFGTAAVDFTPPVASISLTVSSNTVSGAQTGLHITNTRSSVTGNTISIVTVAGVDFDGGIVAGVSVSTFNSNMVTSAGHGLKLAHLGSGSVVGIAAPGNTVTLTGALDDQYAILISASLGTVSVANNSIILGSMGMGSDFGIGVQNSGGVVTVASNTITCQKSNSGIFLFGNATGRTPVVTGNIVTDTDATAVSGTFGRTTGIILSDVLTLSASPTGTAGAATIQNNNIVTGFDRGIDVLKFGTTGGVLTATIGGTAVAQGNLITGAKTSGVRVLDINKKGTTAPSANAQITFNTGISGTGIGIDIDGGSAFVGQNTISGNTTAGVRMTNGGIATSGSNPGLFQNTISGNGVGVLVDGTLQSAEQNFITGSTTDGIAITANGVVSVRIFNNDLSGNHGFAINNPGSLINASANWFGTISQITVTATISGTVDYTPWFNTGNDTSLGTVGFQGDFSYLNVWNGSPQPFGSYINEAVGLLGPVGSNFVIKVWPYTTSYNETVSLNKKVLLMGAKFQGDPLSRNAMGESTIDGTLKGSPLVLVSAGGAGSTIDGFTIVNSTGISVQISSSSTLLPTTLSNNIINGRTNSDAIKISSSGAVIKANLLYATVPGSRSGITIDNNVQSTLVDSNEISNCSVAAVNLTGNNNNTTIRNNKLLNNNSGSGINLQGGSSTGVVISKNSIQTFGLNGLTNSSSGSMIDATLNYWGDSSGPFDSTNNPAGLGSTVTNLGTSYSEWLGDGTDRLPGTIGFQPNPTPVYGLATQLVFDTQPGNGLTNQHINPQPVIKALDTSGNLALSYNGQITVLLFNNTTFASLIGTTTLFATNGVAQFSDLGVNKAGTYTRWKPCAAPD